MSSYIFYQNWLQDLRDNIDFTGSSSSLDTDPEDATDYRTNTFFKPDLAGPSYELYIDFGEAVSADYVAFVATGNESRGSVNPLVNIQSSVDGVGYSTRATINFKDNPHAKVEMFNIVTHQYWRLQLQNFDLEAPVIPHFQMGESLLLPHGQQASYQPPTIGRQTTYSTNVAQNGAFLGRSIKSSGIKGRIKNSHLDPIWSRTEWLPFIQHAELLPFFYSWNHQQFPNEAVYCWLNPNQSGPVYDDSLFMSFDIQFTGLYE